jgi:hypothetical protein
MFTIRLIRDPSELPSLKPVWNELLSRSDMDIIYMTYEWFRMYWELLER